MSLTLSKFVSCDAQKEYRLYMIFVEKMCRRIFVEILRSQVESRAKYKRKREICSVSLFLKII